MVRPSFGVMAFYIGLFYLCRMLVGDSRQHYLPTWRAAPVPTPYETFTGCALHAQRRQ